MISAATTFSADRAVTISADANERNDFRRLAAESSLDLVTSVLGDEVAEGDGLVALAFDMLRTLLTLLCSVCTGATYFTC